MPRKPTGQLVKRKTGYYARHIAVVDGERKHVSTNLNTMDETEANARLAELVAQVPEVSADGKPREWKPPAWLVTSELREFDVPAIKSSDVAVVTGLVDDCYSVAELLPGVFARFIAAVDGNELWRSTSATGLTGGWYLRGRSAFSRKSLEVEPLNHDANRLDAAHACRTYATHGRDERNAKYPSSVVWWAGGETVAAYCEEHAATMSRIGDYAGGVSRWQFTYVDSEGSDQAKVVRASSGAAFRQFAKIMAEVDADVFRCGRKRRHYTRSRMSGQPAAWDINSRVADVLSERADAEFEASRKTARVSAPVRRCLQCNEKVAGAKAIADGFGRFCDGVCCSKYIAVNGGVKLLGAHLSVADVETVLGVSAAWLTLSESLAKWEEAGGLGAWRPEVPDEVATAVVARAKEVLKSVQWASAARQVAGAELASLCTGRKRRGTLIKRSSGYWARLTETVDGRSTRRYVKLHTDSEDEARERLSGLYNQQAAE